MESIVAFAARLAEAEDDPDWREREILQRTVRQQGRRSADVVGRRERLQANEGDLRRAPRRDRGDPARDALRGDLAARPARRSGSFWNGKQSGDEKGSPTSTTSSSGRESSCSRAPRRARTSAVASACSSSTSSRTRIPSRQRSPCSSPPTTTRPTDVLALTPRPGGLTVVGDPKQSIYRFRGADISVYDAVRNGPLAGDAPAARAELPLDERRHRLGQRGLRPRARCVTGRAACEHAARLDRQRARRREPLDLRDPRRARRLGRRGA